MPTAESTALALPTLRQLVIEYASESPAHHVRAIAEWLETEHRDLVDALVMEQRNYLLARHVGDILRSNRANERRRPLPTAQDLVDTLREGRSVLDASYVVDDNGTRKPLRLLVASDHFYVAGQYALDEREAAFYKSVHRRIGRRLRRHGTDTTTESLYAVDELLELMKGSAT